MRINWRNSWSAIFSLLFLPYVVALIGLKFTGFFAHPGRSLWVLLGTAMSLCRADPVRFLRFFSEDILLIATGVILLSWFLARTESFFRLKLLGAMSVLLGFYVIALAECINVVKFGSHFGVQRFHQLQELLFGYPDAVWGALSLSLVTKLVGGTLFAFSSSFLLLIVSRQRRRVLLPSRFVTVARGASVGIILLAAIVSLWQGRIASNQKSMLQLVYEASRDRPRIASGPLPPPEVLKARYEQLAFDHRDAVEQPTGGIHPPVVPGANVIIVVWETAPYRYASPDVTYLPGLKRLSERAIVGKYHYTTYPRSTRALFSILTSTYPLPGSKNIAWKYGRYRADALPQILARRGYVSLFFGDVRNRNKERFLINQLGFDEIRNSRHLLTGSLEDPLWQMSGGARRYEIDRRLYQAAVEAIARLWDAHRPFLMVLAPSLGHFRFDDVPEVTNKPFSPRTWEGRVKNLSVLRDRLLEAFTDQLAQFGVWERTILVVTSDHGFRSQIESPHFDPLYLNDETYHVPLVIYAPSIFSRRVTLDVVTSHIDITPSILALLGIPHTGYMHQGMPVWDERLSRRYTFLLGWDITGSDGFLFREASFMRNTVAEREYFSSGLLAFDERARIDPRSGREYRRRLDAFHRLQEQWIRYYHRRALAGKESFIEDVSDRR
ncbi:MAG: LTA synthase family protein [Acidobacteria bacterium]|nr:MAG: LTA synthase family protein [Acidobacteriota bacterium]